MKVLQLVHKPQRRGAEIFASQLSVALEREGDDVRIVYLYDAHGLDTIALRQHDRVLGVPEHSVFERVPGVNPQALGELRRIFRRFAPDVIQVNGGRTVKYGAYAKALGFTGDAMLIYRNIGNPADWSRGGPRRLLYRQFIMPRLDGVVGVSQTTLDGVRQTYGVEAPMQAIPGGIAPDSLVPQRLPGELRAQAAIPEDAHILVSVGKLSPEKRIDRLFEVIATLRRRGVDAHLWLVGSGPLERELRQQAQALDVDDSTTFWGSSDDVASYVAAADVLVLSSETEGLPGVILEAGYLRRPSVAMNVGGVIECIRDGETGILVPAGDVARMATGVEELLGDEARRVRMGEAAHNLVSREFLIEGIARQYRQFYAQVCASRRRGSHRS